MSTELPSLEARVRAQERMQTMLHARIEELSEDMTASFKAQADYQVQFEQKVDARFDQVDARFDKIEAEIATLATKEDVADLKSDITALEKRMLGAFQQLLTIIEERIPPLEK